MYNFDVLCDKGYVITGTKEVRMGIPVEKLCNGSVTVQIFQSMEDVMGDMGVYNRKSFYRYFDFYGSVEGNRIDILNYDGSAVWDPKMSLNGYFHIFTSCKFPCVVFIRIDDAEEID